MDLSEQVSDTQRMSKYTKLPWKVFIGKTRPGIIEIHDQNGEPVINWTGFDDCRRTIEEHTANAILIVDSCNRINQLEAELKSWYETAQTLNDNVEKLEDQLQQAQTELENDTRQMNEYHQEIRRLELGRVQAEMEQHGPFCFEQDTTPNAWKDLQEQLEQSRQREALLIEKLDGVIQGMRYSIGPHDDNPTLEQALRTNTSKSVLRRLDIQLAGEMDEKTNQEK